MLNFELNSVKNIGLSNLWPRDFPFGGTLASGALGFKNLGLSYQKYRVKIYCT